VQGTVRLDPAVAARAAPSDTVFVFARASEGPRMPLAVFKLQAKDLPAKFTLDDSLAMAPQFRLSNFKNVLVNARVSKSGSANPSAGDLEGKGVAVGLGARDVVVTIDRVVP
jgi:cytochrome c-type biogenesis protein CcmH